MQILQEQISVYASRGGKPPYICDDCFNFVVGMSYYQWPSTNYGFVLTPEWFFA